VLGRAYAETVRILLRRLVAPGLIALSLAAFVVSGLHSDETRAQVPSHAATPTYYEPVTTYGNVSLVDATLGCEHVRERCGRRKGTVEVIVKAEPVQGSGTTTGP